jgi:predicted aldo/keto reductase-like oxidoreductase
MRYKHFGKTGVEVSIISMGGHEYLLDGRSRGFNEDFTLATTPGIIFKGFGQEIREKVISLAYEHGINLFDVTQDSEKDALGRNLEKLPPPHQIYVITRPEGMVYTYDKFNVKMTKYELLKGEVNRILKLLRRDCLDFLNVAFMKEALSNDANYLDKISSNINRLKDEGLIKWAIADTFSGQSTYIKQIDNGCFDGINVNFNIADCGALEKVLPLAHKKGLGVITREAFMKGELFKMGKEVGLKDRNKLAQTALKWSLSFKEVTSVIMGTNNPHHFQNNLQILKNTDTTKEDRERIEILRKSRIFQKYQKKKRLEFFQ